MALSRINLSSAERRVLEQLAARPASRRQQQRAQIVLAAAQGRKDQEIASALGVTVSTVRLWRQRFIDQGIDGLADLPRSGRPSVFAVEPAASAVEPESSHPERSELSALARPSREPVSDITLERLLEAASRTISRLGFASTRVSDIAAEADVSPATVHYYFSTKDEILARALLWANARPVVQLEETTASGSPTERLANFIERSIPDPGPRRDEYLLEIELWSRIRRQPELLSIWESYNERWTGHLRTVLEDGAKGGSFKLMASADEVAERLVAMTDGLSAQAAIGSHRMPSRRVRELVTRFAAEQVGLPAKELGATEASATAL